MLPPEYFETLLNKTQQVITRCRHCDDNQIARELLERLLLMEDYKVYMAVKFNPVANTKYTLTEDERVYPGPGDGFIGRYLMWARNGNAPLAFHYWACLCLLGVCAQRRFFLPMAKTIFLNLYVVLGGDKSSGKGQALDPVLYLIKLINERIAGMPEEHRMRLNMMPSDCTQEALISDLMHRCSTPPRRIDEMSINEDGLAVVEKPEEERRQMVDACGFLPLDEMATFFGKDAFNVAKRVPFMTTIKEADDYVKVTKASGTEVLRNVALSMLACCAPDWMQNTIEGDLFGSGFMDRCVWCYRKPAWERRMDKSIVGAAGMDPLQAEGLADWLIDNMLVKDFRTPIELSYLARDTFHNRYQKMVMFEKSGFDAHGSDNEALSANRLSWLLLQVAALHRISEGTEGQVLIQPEHFDIAWQTLKQETESLRTFLQEGRRQKNEAIDRRLMKFLELEGGCVARARLIATHRGLGKSQEVQSLMQELIDQDLVETVKQTTNGRPRHVYRERGHSCEKCELK
jgi:hypothetical protein